MPLQIVWNDITKMKVDAIVNAAKNSLLGGGGVDGSIHHMAGKELLAECKTLNGCETGKAKITKGYNLPCKYVIHTVGPVWQGGEYGEKELLQSCYRNSLELAKEYNCKSVAFPLISSGTYRYPKDLALKIAINTISSFLFENELMVYIVVFDHKSVQLSKKLFSNITAYIDEQYVDNNIDYYYEYKQRLREENPDFKVKSNVLHSNSSKTLSTEEALKEIMSDKMYENETFSEMLLRKISEKGMTYPECYHKANVDKKLFHKIKANKYYKPSKETVLAFAIALELPLYEMRIMLMKAGFALSNTNKFDIIIKYFVEHGKYNIFDINSALFAFEQNTIGC